jgi:predicted transcriptional regulator of viral defense system
MAKLMNQIIFAATIKEKKLYVFSAADVRTLFGLSVPAAASLLHRYKRKGFIDQLKRGLYVFPDSLPPDPYLANRIYSPSYLSLECALSYYGVIPETVYVLTSVTSMATRYFETFGRAFSYRKVKRTAYCGYHLERQKGIGFYIADAEKAFVDTQYFRLWDQLQPLTRFRKEKINPDKAFSYAELFNNKKLTDIIKKALQ